MKPLLNSAEIMDYLDIKRRKFQELAKSDPTFPVRKLGGEWRADSVELREWFNNLPRDILESGNVVQITTKRKRGRPPKRIAKPAGGWEIRIPE